jgi:class 3 adenylate cyclase/tetratricopeptide (TPR) repeat protein
LAGEGSGGALICSTCSAEVQDGLKFCTACGAALVATPPLQCPACGAPRVPEQRYCGECGTALPDVPLPGPEPTPAAPELRLVSVLFVDLVGYTSLSETRDAEDIRELLGRYFEAVRTIIARYAGTTEKFIGDAVMAVWGVPIAREDDAERAVRAGLEVVDAVTGLGEEVGVPQLRARAGVATGQVASLAKPGEGLVVGDRVNTASRAQSAAPPGALVVDDVTHEVTEAAIAYEDAGSHQVKGKAEPLHLWRALRVVAGIGGVQRERGLEAPLVGRDADLRLLKALFHGALERRSARLVALCGAAGVGKSRLLWEFDKYSDGLADTVLWHSGRCLSYGDGAAYWALAEMVRQRFGIAEEASEQDARAKLAAGLDRWVPSAADRAFLEPRLGALLGVAEPGLQRAELFAGWRLFLERLAEQLPVVLVFEDLQWAEDGLLDFIEHVLEWSAASPIFILALTRPQPAGREGWPASLRGATSLQLDALAPEQMQQLLESLVDGLPRRTRAQIVDRAEGVPLYAIEIIRALANRGVLDQRNGRLVLVGELEDLDVPASLSSLLAARLDALEPHERRLVMAMAVFGSSFSRASAAALGDVPEPNLDAVLTALVRKQVLTIRAEPLSPDSGQYAFVQGLLRTVAYEMLSRRDRKPRHLAAAQHLRSLFANDGEDVAELIASHYLDAYRAAHTDDDAPSLRVETIAALRRAARRAAVVGAPESAERAYCNAREIACDAAERTELTRAAGEMALQAGRLEPSLKLLDSAAAEYEQAGREREAAHVAGQIGRALSRLGRNEDAIERITSALDVLRTGARDAEVGSLWAVLGHALLYAGHFEEAAPPLEAAARIAQEMDLPAILSRVLSDKGLICLQDSRPEEARSMFGAAIATAERHDLAAELLLARGNSGVVGLQWDLPEGAEQLWQALALARRLGDRYQESVAAGNLMYVHVLSGSWGEVDQLAREMLENFEDRPGAEYFHYPLTILYTLRGQLDSARASLAGMAAWGRGDDDERQAMRSSAEIRLLRAEGRAEQALAMGHALLAGAIDALGASHDAVRNAWPDALEAALELGRVRAARDLLAQLADQPPGHVPPYLRLQLQRGAALVAAAEGMHDHVEAELRAVIDGLASLAYPYRTACVQLDLAAWLIERARGGEAVALVEHASDTLESLGAIPALARVRELELSQASAPQL